MIVHIIFVGDRLLQILRKELQLELLRSLLQVFRCLLGRQIWRYNIIEMAEQFNRESQITDTLISQRQTISEDQAQQPAQLMIVIQQPLKSKIRIKSLDIYRGLTMVGMIAVDNMGPVKNPPEWLDHPPWHGLTVADFIFPAFLFIMGMAIPLAISKKRPIRLRNILRVAGLFLIGFMLNLIGRKFEFETVRIMGILQRLSLCYGLMLMVHQITDYGSERKRRFLAVFMFIVYIFYFVLMVTFDGGNDPGCSTSNNLTDGCNINGYIDRKILTPDHMLKHVNTDPQGLLSTFGALITTYLGYEYSILMSKYKSNPKVLASYWLIIAGILGVLIYPAHIFTPFNKKIYTPSFILVVGAVSGASLTFFYYIIDILPTTNPVPARVIEIITKPLLWLGLNPLAIFVLMDLVAIFMIIYIKVDDKSLWTQFYNHAFGSWITDQTIGALAFCFFFVVLWTIVAGIMHRFKLYIRL